MRVRVEHDQGRRRVVEVLHVDVAQGTALVGAGVARRDAVGSVQEKEGPLKPRSRGLAVACGQ